MQRKYVLTQSHCGGSQKNEVLFKEYVKMRKAVTQKQKRFSNTYFDELLGKVSSTDNSSDDSNGEKW